MSSLYDFKLFVFSLKIYRLIIYLFYYHILWFGGKLCVNEDKPIIIFMQVSFSINPHVGVLYFINLNQLRNINFLVCLNEFKYYGF